MSFRNFRLLSLCLLTLLCTPLAAPAEPLAVPDIADLPASAELPELKIAIDRFKAGDGLEALKILQKAVVDHPDLPPAEIMYARMCLSSGNVREGRQAIEQSISSDPTYPDGYLIIGDLAMREGRLTEAGLIYAKAAELTAAYDKDAKRKKDFSIRASMGQAAVANARKQWPEALKFLDEWLKLDPENRTARYQRGVALFGMNKPDQAFDEFTKAGQGDAQFLPPAIALGRLYEREGNKEKTKEWQQYAADQGKSDLKTQLALAQWLWEMGDFAAAKPHAEAALKLQADSLDAKIVLGTILRYLKEHEQAEKYLQDALNQSPGNFTAANQLALALIEQAGKDKQQRGSELAQVSATRLNEQDPRRAEAYATLAWISFKNGKLDDAERFIRAAAQSRQVSSDMAFYMAAISAQRKENDKAMKLLKDALAATGPFAHRQEAQQMLDQLTKAAAARPPVGPTP